MAIDDGWLPHRISLRLRPGFCDSPSRGVIMTVRSLPLAEHRVFYRELRRKAAGENSGQFGLNILAARLVEPIKVFSRVVLQVEQLTPLWTLGIDRKSPLISRDSLIVQFRLRGRVIFTKIVRAEMMARIRKQRRQAFTIELIAVK